MKIQSHAHTSAIYMRIIFVFLAIFLISNKTHANENESSFHVEMINDLPSWINVAVVPESNFRYICGGKEATCMCGGDSYSDSCQSMIKNACEYENNNEAKLRCTSNRCICSWRSNSGSYYD